MRQPVIISLLTVFQLGFALFFQTILIGLFGLSGDLDIFYASNTISFILVSIATSSLNYALTPMFIELKNRKKNKRLTQLISSYINLAIVVFTFFSILLSVFSKEISLLLFPGFKGEQNLLVANLLAIQSVISIFSVVVGILTAVHYSENRLYRTVLFPLFATFAQLICVYILHQTMGIYSIVLASAINQLALLVTLGSGYFKTHTFSIIFDKYLVRSLKNISPLLFSSFFSKADLIVNRYFASMLVGGAISSLHFGGLAINVLSTFINKGISIVSLRFFSLNIENPGKSHVYFEQLCKTMIALTAFISLNVVLFFPYISKLLLLSETISRDSILMLNNVVICLLGVFVGGVLSSIIVNPFYTKGLTFLVSRLSVAIQLVSIFVSIVMFKIYGFYALPIVMSIRSLINSFLLMYLYNKYIHKVNASSFYIFLLKLLLVYSGLYILALYSQSLLNQLLLILAFTFACFVVMQRTGKFKAIK